LLHAPVRLVFPMLSLENGLRGFRAMPRLRQRSVERMPRTFPNKGPFRPSIYRQTEHAGARLLGVDNPWLDVPTTPRFIAPCDLQTVDLVLAADPNAQSELHFEVLPEPYAGDPERARVVLLSLNPGWGNTEPGEQGGGVADWDDELRRNLAFNATTPFVHIDPRFQQTTGGGRWWSKRLRRLAEATSWEQVGERLMVLEFFGYHSHTWRSLPLPLPSQAFTFQLLREAMDKGNLIIVTRGLAQWVWNVPELYTYKRVIRLNSQRWVGLSPGNMPVGDFDRVVEAVTSEHP
jgi:hypothetical protein